MHGLTVEHAMDRRPLVVPADTPLGAIYGSMRSRTADEVLVMPSSWQETIPPIRPIGILTVRDALEAAAQDAKWRESPVARFMVHPVLTVSADHDLDQAIAWMDSLGVHRLPVVSQGVLVGLLTSESALRARAEQLRRLERQLQRREREALHDPLTGLPNRRLFQEVLEREFQMHRRNYTPLALLLLDVDLFKKVNDTYGHPVGDLVLKQLATRLQTTVRRSDLLARVGGEEFAVLAAVAEQEQALILGEKLRSVVASAPFAIPTGPCLQDTELGSTLGSALAPASPKRFLNVTVSIGVALSAGQLVSHEELVRVADAALYVAKHRGRNTVWLAKR